MFPPKNTPKPEPKPKDEPFCLICGGSSWCGRPCIHDPKKSNALIFHPNGKPKTLKERGLGFDDPPLAKPPPRLPPKLKSIRLHAMRTVPGIKPVAKTPVANSDVANSPSVAKSPPPNLQRSASKRGRPAAANPKPSTLRARKRRAEKPKPLK
jgi:hypothetical protein